MTTDHLCSYFTSSRERRVGLSKDFKLVEKDFHIDPYRVEQILFIWLSQS